MARPREFDPSEVLSQVMDVFWKEGYEKSSFAMIEEQTGVKKASLCAAFGDKHDLFLAALRNYHETSLRLSEEYYRQPSPKASIRLRLAAAADMCSGVKGKRGCFQVNSIIELAPHDPEVAALVKEHTDRVIDQISATIHQGQQAGEFKTDTEPSILAKFVVSSLYGLSVAGKAGMRGADIERIVEVVLNTLER